MRRASFALLVVAGLIGCGHYENVLLDPRVSRQTLTGDESPKALGIITEWSQL